MKKWTKPTVTEIPARPLRIQRSRSKGWRMPPNTVYVGRPGKYGNPFQVGRYIPIELLNILDGADYANRQIGVVFDATEAVRLYKKYFPFTGTPYELTTADLAEIAGKNLACWCKLGEPCHGDVLLKKVNS